LSNAFWNILYTEGVVSYCSIDILNLGSTYQIYTENCMYH